MPRPITSLIPRSIYWAPTPAAVTILNNGGDPSKPMKLWADPAAAARVAAAAATRNSVSGWYLPPGVTVSVETPVMSYKAIARNPDGSVRLAAIGSPEFYKAYTSLGVVRAYQQYAFMFPNGAPYLVDMLVPADQAAHVNTGGKLPALDWPLELWANHMLALDGGDVVVWEYEEFARAMAAHNRLTPAERRAAIAAIASGPDADTDAFAKMRELLTFSGNQTYQLT